MKFAVLIVVLGVLFNSGDGMRRKLSNERRCSRDSICKDRESRMILPEEYRCWAVSRPSSMSARYMSFKSPCDKEVYDCITNYVAQYAIEDDHTKCPLWV